MGKHKRSVVGALDHLVRAGAEVVAVVAPEPDGARARVAARSTSRPSATACGSRPTTSCTPRSRTAR